MTLIETTTRTDRRHHALSEVLASTAVLAERAPSGWSLDLHLAVHELVTMLVRETAAADPSFRLPAPSVLEPPVVYLRTLAHLAQRTAGRDVVLLVGPELDASQNSLRAALAAA